MTVYYLSTCSQQKKNRVLCYSLFLFYFIGLCSPARAMASSFTRFLDHTRRATIRRTHLDEWSVRRRDLYLTTLNTHNRQTSIPSVGFEPTITAGERPYTYALDRAATGTGYATVKKLNKEHILSSFAKQWLLSSKIVTVCLVVRIPSFRIELLSPTGRILMKFYIGNINSDLPNVFRFFETERKYPAFNIKNCIPFNNVWPKITLNNGTIDYKCRYQRLITIVSPSLKYAEGERL
jgi:hypothetical protein